MEFESNDEVVLVKSDAADYIRDLKQEGNGKLWLCGGGQLAGSLIEHKLIDKLVLKVNPLMLGSGIPLFGNASPRLRFELIDLKRYDNGVVKPTYQIIYP